MSELSLNRKFDLITSVLDSTNYIIEEDKFVNYLMGVKEHLNDNGLFIFDINSYYKLSNILGNNILTGERFKLADFDNNGKIDSMDMYLLIEKILK